MRSAASPRTIRRLRPARDSRHWPYIGSVVDYLSEKQADNSKSAGIPRNIGLPWMLNSKTDQLVNAGPFAAFLGQAYDPVWTDFIGEGTRHVPHYSDSQKKDFLDPFGGCKPEGRFQLSPAGRLSDDVPIERVALRRSLLTQFERARREIDASASARPFEKHRERAYALLTTDSMRQALDLGRESLAIRESYGMTLFGQACLASRRLVEAGGSLSASSGMVMDSFRRAPGTRTTIIILGSRSIFSRLRSGLFGLDSRSRYARLTR